MLRRFVEVVIDEGTARGWVQLDDGTWQYYNWQGKLVTGWQALDGKEYYLLPETGVLQAGKWLKIGSKWYYFKADGTLAVNTTIDGYEVGADGAWQE